jgi:hypothetical protein
MAARLDYSPVVDVRRTSTKQGDVQTSELAPVSAVIEAAKYAAKATDLLALGDQLPDFHREVRGLRLLGVSKQLRSYVGETELQKEDLLDGDLLADPSLPPTLSAVAQWFDESQEYRFVI